MLGEIVASILNGVYQGANQSYNKYNIQFEGQMTYFTLLGILDTFLKEEISGKILIKNIYEYYMIFYFLQKQEMPNINRNEHILEYDILKVLKEKKALKINRNLDNDIIQILSKGKIFTRNLLGNRLNTASCLTHLSPVIAFYDQPKLAFRVGMEIASMTHGDADTQVCGGAYAFILAELAQKKKIVDIVEECIAEIKILKEGISTITMLNLLFEYIDSEFTLEDVRRIKTQNISYRVLICAILVFYYCKDDYNKAIQLILTLDEPKNISIVYANFYGAYYKKLCFENEEELEFYPEFFEATERLYNSTLIFNEEEEVIVEKVVE